VSLKKIVLPRSGSAFISKGGSETLPMSTGMCNYVIPVSIIAMINVILYIKKLDDIKLKSTLRLI
jgi:hypothetical protein